MPIASHLGVRLYGPQLIENICEKNERIVCISVPSQRIPPLLTLPLRALRRFTRLTVWRACDVAIRCLSQMT
jgi:hypothetical protein